MKMIDLTGQTFSRLTVIQRGENTSKGQARWICRCVCGNETQVFGSALRNGHSRSCGCLKDETTVARNTTHGHATHGISPTYHTWSGMIARCTNPKHRDYKRYGKRGITVCERWLNSFADFLADMGEKPEGMSIDRRNTDGNYEPDNCQWADKTAQSRNKSNNRIIEFNGESKTLIEWAESLHISQSTLRERLDKWTLEKALTTPKIKSRNL